LLTNALELGCDCLGEIVYLDGIVNDNDGKADPAAERDLPARGGSRHRVEAHQLPHWLRGGSPPAADGHLSIVTVAITSTAITGTCTRTQIEYEVKLSAFISNGALPEGEASHKHGTVVAPRVYARTISTSSTSAWTWPLTAP